MINPNKIPTHENFIAGQRACKGCGKALAARLTSKISLGCAPAQKVIIGIDRRLLLKDPTLLSRGLNNRQPALYLCFDSEPYLDILIDKAIPLPFKRSEKPFPVSENDMINAISEKWMPAEVKTETFSYMATACPSYPLDLIGKVTKAIDTPGNAFILVLSPCPTGWIFSSDLTIEVGLNAVSTGYFPLYEAGSDTFCITEYPQDPGQINKYLSVQKRFQTFPPDLISVMQKAVDGYHEKLSCVKNVNELIS